LQNLQKPPGAVPGRPCPNIRVTRGKVSSHNFAFSSVDTKSSSFVRLLSQKTGILKRKISSFGNSAKSK
jgi:hypothetical protein